MVTYAYDHIDQARAELNADHPFLISHCGESKTTPTSTTRSFAPNPVVSKSTTAKPATPTPPAHKVRDFRDRASAISVAATWAGEMNELIRRERRCDLAARRDAYVVLAATPCT
jgi:hypothetical protein